MNRRRFLQTAASAALLSARGHTEAVMPVGPKAPFRVIYSNDTTNLLGCTSPWHKKGEPFRPEMLEASIDEVAGKVDAHFLQPGLGEVPMWPSKVEPVEAHYRWIKDTYGQEPDAFGRYVLGGGDVVKVFVERCRQRGQAPFISVRLNDAHHKELVNAQPGDKGGSVAMAITRFYREHPEFRIGPKLGSAQFQVLNWAHPEVPARKLALLTELAENYDLDGIELDFLRFYSFFPKEGTTSEQRRAIVTQFIRDVRLVLNRTARGRRRWLCARVSGFLSTHDQLGIDLPVLVANGLDMVNLSASYFTTQQMDVAAIRRSIPAFALYVELCHSTWNGPKLAAGYDVFPFRRATVEQLATTARQSYARGADGVSLFNFAYYREHGGPGWGSFHEPPFEVLPRLADRVGLTRSSQHWFLGPGWDFPLPKTERLPREVVSGGTASFIFDLAPPEGGWKKDARLRIQTLNPMAGQEWSATFNGFALAAVVDVSEPFSNPDPPMLGTPETLRAWAVPTDCLRTGDNQLVFRLKGEAAAVVFVDLAMV